METGAVPDALDRGNANDVVGDGSVFKWPRSISDGLSAAQGPRPSVGIQVKLSVAIPTVRAATAEESASSSPSTSVPQGDATSPRCTVEGTVGVDLVKALEPVIGFYRCFGVEAAIMSMRASSTAVVRIAGGDARGDVHVELEWVQAVARPWALSAEDRMRVAESCKEYASRYVQIGQHSWATTYYGWAAQSAILVATQAPTETKGTCHDENLRQPATGKAKALLLACYLNLALCHLKSRRYKKAVDAASRAISQDADSAKGFFRRGIAYRHLNNLQRSISDLGTAHRLKRTDKRINDELVTSQRLLDEQNAAMKSGLAKFFG